MGKEFFLLSKADSDGKSYSLAQDHSKRIVQIFCLKMVGRDGHLVIGAKHAEGINQQAAHRLFNSMNCLLLAEKKPTTLAMLEEAYLEMEGSSVPHHKFGFPSGLHLVAAWFDRAWFRGQVVIVPIFSDQVAHLFSADCRFRSIWSRLPKVDSWVPSLFLASASLVIERLEANLSGKEQVEGLDTFGLPATVTETMQELLQGDNHHV